MSAPTWAEVQAAIHAFVVAATGITASRVRWADQGGDQPASSGGAWISLSVLTEGPTGKPWLDVEDAAVPTPLADIDFVARSQNAGTLSIQIYGASPHGDTSGVAILRKLRPALVFPSIRAIVQGVVGFGAFEVVRNTPALINATYFEPRAIVSCRFHTAAEIRTTAAGPEVGTYVETVEIDGTVDP